MEYHLMGNHILEDAYSLFVASVFFGNIGFYKLSSRLLRRELKEQILSDGAHYEQSPMYHCILLDRLLDCYNISSHNLVFEDLSDMDDFLASVAVRMLGHLEAVVYSDGDIPLLNDSAKGIAPTPDMIYDYAGRLGLKWDKVRLGESGYRKMTSERLEAVMDVGGMAASYQPGHSHADTFNFELRIDGRPFVADTGISTYNKTARRLYERGTSAHNTVVVGNRNSSEVWDGFRVGRRADVEIMVDEDARVVSKHNGYAPVIHVREFEMKYDSFVVTDEIAGQGVCLIHLAPGVIVCSFDINKIVTDCGVISLHGADRVKVEDCYVSNMYNILDKTNVIKIDFSDRLNCLFEVR